LPASWPHAAATARRAPARSALRPAVRDRAVRALLVVAKARPDLAQMLVQAVALGPAHDRLSLCLERLGAAVLGDLDLDERIGFEVVQPLRMLRRAALRRHDDVAVAVFSIDEGRRDLVAALRSLRGQQQQVVPPRAHAEALLGVALLDGLLVPVTRGHRSQTTAVCRASAGVGSLPN